MKQRLAILGSTGSIGVQTLDIARENPGRFEVRVLTANRNWATTGPAGPGIQTPTRR